MDQKESLSTLLTSVYFVLYPLQCVSNHVTHTQCQGQFGITFQRFARVEAYPGVERSSTAYHKLWQNYACPHAKKKTKGTMDLNLGIAQSAAAVRRAVRKSIAEDVPVDVTLLSEKTGHCVQSLRHIITQQRKRQLNFTPTPELPLRRRRRRSRRPAATVPASCVTVCDSIHDAGAVPVSAVDSVDVVTDAVDSVDVATDAMDSVDVATDAVDSVDVVNDAVDSVDVVTDAVDSVDVPTDAVDSVDVVTDAVDSVDAVTDGVDSTRDETSQLDDDAPADVA